MDRIERDKLVEIYYNEVLEKFLKPIIEKKVTIPLVTEMSRVIEVADKEDITIKIITQPTNFIWISVLCRLSHSSAEFHLSYNNVFPTVINNLSYSDYTGTNNEVKETLKSVDKSFYKFTAYKVNDKNELVSSFFGRPKTDYLTWMLTELMYASDTYSDDDELAYNKYELWNVKHWDTLKTLLDENPESTKYFIDENGNLIFILNKEKFILLKEGNEWKN